MTEDQFYEDYFYPFEVRGKNLEDDVESIRNYYRNLMLECNTIPEMMGVAREFKFLAAGVVPALNRLSNFYVQPIKDQFLMKEETQSYEIEFMCHILVPKIMLHASLIAHKFGAPEYVAAFQYARAIWFPPKQELAA